MRLSIDHTTRYRFSVPQGRVVQMLRLTPSDSHDQTVAAWRIDVDCNARLRNGRDGFGNVTTMLYAEGPLEAIEIAVSGAVVTSHSDGLLHGVAEPLPPPVFLRTTPATLADEALAAFAQESTGGAANAIGRLHRLNTGLHARFAVSRDRPEPGLIAADAFARTTATPRDMAQMFVAAARALGSPARYVSGYSLDVEDHRPAPHGWAEAHVAGVGWIGFDPCLGLSPEERHVRVAAALDAAGAAPVAGSRLGEGAEVLDVDVSVHREE
ncbi:MAG: transglutaminase family protein [Janthinobacterium lividum]